MPANLTLRDLPDPLHAWLRERAKAHHRSVNKEIIALLDEARTGSAARRPDRADASALLALAGRLSGVPDSSAGASEEELLGLDPDTGLPR
ncbi:MAG: hypothetical protein RIS35_2298 [Pseudomonadota bacterium]|jgi:plasmid stability protein